MVSTKTIIVMLLVVALDVLGLSSVKAQVIPASQAVWSFPQGNRQATRYQSIVSRPQNLDSMVLRWSSPIIAGDVEPLIANVVNNSKLSPLNPFAPLELVCLVNGSIVVMDATGRIISRVPAPRFTRSVSVIMDSSQLSFDVYDKFTSLLGIESTEYYNPQQSDSLAKAYIYGCPINTDTLLLLKHLALDVRPYAPNLFAGIRPLYARPFGTELMIYTSVNQIQPDVSGAVSDVPFFRGLTQFQSGGFVGSFPLPDIGDTSTNRVTFGPDMSVGQPSISDYNGRTGLALPCYPTKLDYTIPYPLRSPFTTNSLYPYLTSVEIQGFSPAEGITPIDMDALANNSSRPRIKPYYIDIIDGGASNISRTVVLVAEEFLGRDSSFGRARLHLYETDGTAITSPLDASFPSFIGDTNHAWGVAVANVDGLDTNEYLPYYPHNPGKEIIVTQTTKDFAYPGSELMILRFRTGTPIQKTAPRNSYLNQLDTIFTQQINGWVAATGDINNKGDGKDEIVLADGGDLYVLTLRDYKDATFRSGDAFDTLFTHSFKNEQIGNVSLVDLDGDGYLDIVVTTNVQSYVFGIISPATLLVTDPSPQNTGITSFCRGDSARVSWYNVLRGQPSVRIRFKEYRNGVAIDTGRVIASNIINSTDTVTYSFLPDSLLAGKLGILVVESMSNSFIKDSTGLLEFYKPKVTLQASVRSAEFVSTSTSSISVLTQCVDSLQVFIGVGSKASTFVASGTRALQIGDTVSIVSAKFPCPSFYNCSMKDADSIALLYVVGYNSVTKERVLSDTARVLLRPAEFQVNINPPPSTLCAERYVRFFAPSDTTICDTLHVSYSLNGGATFVPIKTFLRKSDVLEFSYYPPVDAKDSVLLRLCCQNTCYRVDTVLQNARSKFIHEVIPNPWNPDNETLQVFSSPSSAGVVSVKVYDQASNVVAWFGNTDIRKPGLVYCDTWNGTVESGSKIGNGMFYIVVESTAGEREFYPVFIRRK